MHFFSRRNASLALSLAAVGVLAACGDDVTVPIEPPPPVLISITPQAVTLNPGSSAPLSVQITGGNPTPTLASCTTGSTAVATAVVAGSNGCTVTAVAAGSTTITATTTRGQAASASLTVSALPSALGQLTVTPATVALSVGQTTTLVPNANPSGASVTTTFTYVSSSPAIATVNASGVVTAASAGTTTITVTATGTGAGFVAATRTFGATVTVSNSPPGMSALNVSPTSLTLATGGTGQLTSAVTQPAGATAAVISYLSSNTAIATVAGSGANATVTAVAPGTATITVTATAAATSTLSAVTLTQLIPVTVARLPVVSIEAVTQGPIVTTNLDSAYSVTSGGLAGGPVGPTSGVIAGIRQALNPQIDQSVDIANTKDQIQVRLNLETNGATVDSVVVYINPATTAGRRAAARQISPQAGQLVTGYINTADFFANATTGIGEVFYTNGLKEISASVWTALPVGASCPVPVIETTVSGQTRRNCEIQIASNNRQSFNFNNIDNFALTMQASDTRSALDADQRSWWGGPTGLLPPGEFGGPGTDRSGHVSFQVWPVIFTPLRTIDRVQATFGRCRGFGVGGIPNGVEKVGAPYTFTVGDRAPAGSATFIDCAGLTGAYDGLDNFRFEDYPMVTYSLDNSQNPGPRNIYAYNPNLGTNVFAGPRPSLYRQSALVQSPNAIRVDYRAPTLTLQSPSNQERWVNDTYAFASAYSANDQNSGFSSGSFPGPVGVGIFAANMRTQARVAFSARSANVCGGPQTFTVFGGLTSTVANFSPAILAANREHPCDFTNDAFALQVSEIDRLGNRATSTEERLFGIDNTVPTVENAWVASGTANMPNHYLAVGDSIFQGGGALLATPIAAAPAANATDFNFGTRYRDTRSGFNITNHGSRIVRRFRPDATPLLTNRAVVETVSQRTMTFVGGNGNPVENQDPTFRRDSVTIYGHGPLANNLPAGIALVASPLVGYYEYFVTISDRAGNTATRRQRAVIDNTSPNLTGVLIPPVLGATGTAIAARQRLIPTGTDDVEALDSDYFLQYPALGLIGDGNVNSAANDSASRIRFRRNWVADWHTRFAVFNDTLLATPFGQGTALSDAGILMEIATMRGLESVDSTNSPISWGTPRPFGGFKFNQLGIYAFDVRATQTVAFPIPYAASPPFRYLGMSNMFPGIAGPPATGEPAYLETIFAGNVSNGSRWAEKDFGNPTVGFQGLVTWAGFGVPAGNLVFRATVNSVSAQPVFPLVHVVKWEPTAQVTGSGITLAAAQFTDRVEGQWVYIGTSSSATNPPALFDQGSARVWQYTLTFPATTNATTGRIIQPGTAAGGCYRAIGVDASGDGIASLPFGTGCPVYASAGAGNAVITLRAFGPGQGDIQATTAPLPFALSKGSNTNQVVRVSQARTGAQTFLISPAPGSTLQTAPAGCALTGGPYVFPTSTPVTCEVLAGFGTRNLTAIFDSANIP